MRLRLLVTTSHGDGTEWHHDGHSFVIGRSPDCQLSIPDETAQVVSWQHARIELYSDHAIVTDLKSTNGTWLNGVQIRGPVRLGLADEIRLGQTGPRLIVRSFGPSAPSVAQELSNPAVIPVQPIVEQHMRQRTGVAWPALFVGLLVILASASIAVTWLRSPGPEPITESGGCHGKCQSGSPSGEPIVDLQRVASANERAVLWIGLEVSDLQYAWFTGFAVGPHTVVSTADQIEFLTKNGRLIGDDIKLIVGAPSMDSQVFHIESVRFHPDYDASVPSKRSNSQYNLAVLWVREKLPAHCALATRIEIAETVQTGRSIAVLGTEITKEMRKTELSDSNRPVFRHTLGTITHLESPAKKGEMARAKLHTEVIPGRSGGPIISSSGKVLGVLFQEQEAVFCIPLDGVTELVK